MISHNRNSDDVIIIGSGSCGLAAAYELHKHGIPVRIVDKAHRPGEAWHHRHPQLRLNTHRYLSGLPGMTVPKIAGAFPSRDSIIHFLEDYANKLDVPIDYGVNVKHVNRSSENWIIETDAGIYTTQHVVVATGHDSMPCIPDWMGRETFRKTLIHAADFGELSKYRGKKILVVGAGNSGTDILNHLSRIETNKVWVSVRDGPVVFPTHLYGMPVQLLSPLLAKLPVPVVDRMLSLTEYLAFGNLKKWGLSKHPDGGATRLLQTGTAPAIDNGFIGALKAGKVNVVAEIQAFEESAVRLVNGQRIEADVVIAATGYRTGLETILMIAGVLDELGIPTIHGAQQLDGYPGLYFTGMQPRLPGVFHAAGIIADEIARAIKAELDISRTDNSNNETISATESTTA